MMKNFTFVTHKDGRPEKSELVKSHVMREAQRKRREDKQRRQRVMTGVVYQTPFSTFYLDGAASSPADLIGLSTSPFPSAAADVGTNGNVWNSDPVATSNSLTSYCAWATYPLPSQANFGGGQEQCHPASTDAYGFSIPGAPISASFGQTYEEVSNALQEFLDQNSSLTLLASDVESSLESTPPFLIRQPSILYATVVSQTEASDSPWMSRSLFDRVVELTWHYGNTLLIERAGHPPVNPCMYWQQVSLTKPTVLLTCALFHCAYQDVITGRSSDHHDYYKAKALQLINSAMSTPETAISDDNISAVLSMCMYENVRGSTLLMTHLKGLRQMVDMRGGINNLPADQGQHLSENIILQDLIHATCSNVPPFLIDICEPILRDTRGIGLEYFYPQSPLRVVDGASFDRLDSQLQPSLQILKDAFDGLEMLCIESFDLDTAADEAEVFKTRCDTFMARLKQSGQQHITDRVPETLEKRVEEAIRLAATIHFRAVTLRTQHDDESNAEDMKKLHLIVRRIDMTFWKIAPYTYLWIQLTGGAASHKHPAYRPYFVSEIMRLGLSVGLFDWRPFRQILGNFMWLQQYLRRNKPQVHSISR